MNRTALTLGLCLAVLGSGVRAADEGPYASAGASLHMANKSRFYYEDPVGTLAGNSTVNFGAGFGLAAAGGYRWTDTIRTELELSYRSASLDNIALENAAGKQSSVSLMANALIDVGIGTNFFPYIGAGIGLANNKWKGVSTPTSPVYSDSDKKMQWQAILGFEMPINPQTSWYADYRFIGSTDNQFHSITTNPYSRVVNLNLSSHNLMVGVRFRFGGASAPIAVAPPPKPAPLAAAPAPAPALAPAPPPAPQRAAAPPPPIPQNFLVFFDFDRSDIRDDARKIITEAADFAKKNGKSRITTTGHADTSGTPAYNLALSERRARAVKTSLLQLGFADNEIAVAFRGETEPLVQTGDGVREPQNRRVEIVMN